MRSGNVPVAFKWPSDFATRFGKCIVIYYGVLDFKRLMAQSIVAQYSPERKTKSLDLIT